MRPTSPRYNNVHSDQNTPAIPIDMPTPSKNNAHFDGVLQRLHRLSISTAASEPRSPLSPLGPAFSFSHVNSKAAAPTYEARPAPALDLSPQSSASSDFSSVSSGRDSFDAFVRTQSRVVRISNLPPMPHGFLSSLFAQHGLAPTLWMSHVPAANLCVWAVFQTHREACAALALSSHRMSVAAALESDLEPFSKLQRFELNAGTPQLYMNPQRVPEEYTISSNPPNPRTSFRLGDWICRSQNCAAHNFGRNLTCIGCGCPRSSTATADNEGLQSPHHFSSFQSSNPPPHSSRPQPSPRFVSAANTMQQYPGNLSPIGYGFVSQPPSPSYNRVQQQQAVMNLPPPSPLPSPSATKSNMHAHPLLTPSGRAFAVGGKVQNISSDPLSPCIMYWPDNEPFPEQGQIRPGGLMSVQPPILNTGNRGPISHQPGDWICLKCNYLNWRRRKVCQTCLPYAEGNGDSVSAAVQAERIALLTSVLEQTHLASPAPAPAHAQPHPHLSIGRSHSTTPAQNHRSFVSFSPPPSQRQPRAHVYRSQSHSELGSQQLGYAIYQTGQQHQQQQQHFLRQHHPSPLGGQRTLTLDGRGSPVDMYAPAPLLPSFLQDIVQSPALSPSSTSSADLSLDEYEEHSPASTRSTFSQADVASIWRLDGEESKSLAAFPLARQELMRGGHGSASSSRNPSLERLRMHISSS
ncbi:hypothetical protein DFH08DRAFT_988022 [Mycena albidolilacea]|uniref:RanBP2-type domain-containing protein n=1 Tax=Mycena albidolilacea TaxID=1033008 RepID=A0AAD7AAP2_9AGAR|nr:hypothetical protein DFH08DRAFT_988022 [Mycena albidolilacea]